MATAIVNPPLLAAAPSCTPRQVPQYVRNAEKQDPYFRPINDNHVIFLCVFFEDSKVRPERNKLATWFNQSAARWTSFTQTIMHTNFNRVRSTGLCLLKTR
jgi:hypothetical protein